MSSTVFSIESGVFALSLVGDSDPADWQAPGGKTVDAVVLADYATNGGDFSCQITAGALEASPNQSDDVTPATFCSPEQTRVKVGVTSYSVVMSALQDPQVMAGLNRYLFEGDTKLAYFFLGLDGVNPPKVAGRCRLVSGTIGGEARVTLTFELSLPCESKPDVEFGDAVSSIVIEGGTPATRAATFTAGTPGTFSPPEATEPSTLAELTSGTAVTASPATAWTTGQYVQLPTTSAVGDRVHWNGTAWVTGVAAATQAQTASAAA